MRRFVIGDIHGCAKALRTLLETIAPTQSDQVIFLGDYIDRGPDSRDVIDQVIAISQTTTAIALLGNHEIMLRGVAKRGFDSQIWLRSGGQATVSSYGGSLDKIPAAHWHFFDSLVPYHESQDAIFVHAGYQFDVPMTDQDDVSLYWNHLDNTLPPHCSGKRVFVGHTPQPSGNILDLGHLVCVDTCCFGGGYLTALELGSYDLVQVDRHGHIRSSPLRRLSRRLAQLRNVFANVRKPAAQ